MLAPEPLLPVFTEGRLMVNAEVPLFLELPFLLRFLFSTTLAVFVGGGGAAGGGVGSGILGDERHIILFVC